MRSKIPCLFEVNETDNDENRILLWTLYVIGRAGIAGDQKASLASAYRALASCVSLVPFTPRDCVGRHYTRLNSDDYASLHGLCRLLLSGSAPLSAGGDLVAPPFLLDMAALFEVFVYRWLELHHLPEGVTVEPQERVVIDESSGLEFRIDLVLHDEAGAALCTLDTKYKLTTTPDSADIHQAVAYAVSVGATEAVLVYPSDLRPELEVHAGGVRVSSASFDLGSASTDAAGAALLASLPPLSTAAPGDSELPDHASREAPQ